VVFGFPLSGSLSSGGKFVVGNVTALTGLGNNRQLLQISAPVQLGNSGGPLLDQYGNVIGVIQSKLDAILVAKQLGEIPENVGFAVKDTVLKDFLDWAGTAYETAVSVYALPVTEVRKKAEAFTTAVECRKPNY
jgi:S1-C subfamily serine protease